MDDARDIHETSLPGREPFFRRLSPAAFVVLTLGLVFFLYQVVAGAITLVVFGNVAGKDTAVWMRLATVLGQVLCILVPTVVLTRARYGSVLVPLRLRLPAPRDVLVIAIAVVALQQVLQGYMIAQDALPLPPQVQRYVEMFKRLIEETYRMLVGAGSALEFAGVVLTVAFVPAIVEELLFRGLVQRDLEDAVGGPRAGVLAGLIFGLYHLNPFSLVPLVALGVYFGFVVYRSQNITLAMTAHFINNFIACCALYLNLGEYYLVFAPGGNATPRVVFWNTVGCAVVFVAATYYFFRVTSKDELS